MTQYNNTYLILETRNLVIAFKSKIKQLTKFDADENKIFSSVFETISNEKNAKIESEYDSMAITSECIGKFYEKDIEILLNIVFNFGMEMHFMLVKLSAYRNGKLPFLYDHCVGNDIVLRYLKDMKNEFKLS